MGQVKFKIGDRVEGNDKKASFWGRAGIVAEWLPKSSEYGVKFDDRAELIEYVMAAWLELLPPNGDSCARELNVSEIAVKESAKVRDDFAQSVKEILAKRVAYRCSNPRCRKVTSGPQEDPTKAINIGVASHITAASPGGPRYDSIITPQERSAIGNGIWLCQSCGKLVDSDPTRYTVTILREWKSATEEEALKKLEVRSPLNAPHEDSLSRIERLMPDLMAEMRKDISQVPLCREFVILKKIWMFSYPDKEMFTYYYEDHDALDGKLRILRNLGMIRDIQYNSVQRFVMEERLVDYLQQTG